MTKNTPSYLLQVGVADRERLEILAELYNPGSQSFLQAELDKSSRSILDIGCGPGQMACWFGEKFLDSKVVGVDISDAQLAICEKRRNDLGVPNVQFFNHDITVEKIDHPLFDAAYCRFLLMHLEKWDGFFEQTLAACKPGGSIFIEEPAFPFFCYPESASLHRANVLGNQLSTMAGLNFDCIAPLWRYIRHLDVDVCAVKFSQPALTTSREKSLLWRSFHQIKDVLLVSKLATLADVNEILTDLDAVARDPRSLVGGLRVIQLHLKKR
ncbi:class I SAM-dependent methyltransferase [Glaciimonas sp. PAMC28666]|uniref:class I SAM-dependent methyltransferase n=1 Tax=Glaciimonas sp. PAMC28666 TaxID=2807626 RepID=UPI001965E41D|nr:class I SAM-dependent methyltransferase [Glaciimonas sp. PAMC28666]QRX81422.1 class I SAM-dependent methyltransferase [Glaciimonas sp. PAMC28666]